MQRGELIRQKRLEAGLTQQELAEQVGLKKSTISRYESGKVDKITRDVALKMSNLLGIELSDLVQNKPVFSLQKKAPSISYDLMESYPSQVLNPGVRPVLVFSSVGEYLKGNFEGMLKVSGLDLGLTHFALKACDFIPKAGFKRKYLVFIPEDELQENEQQLLLINGLPVFGRVKILNDVLAVRTEKESPEDLLLFDLKKENCKVIGTFVKLEGR